MEDLNGFLRDGKAVLERAKGIRRKVAEERFKRECAEKESARPKRKRKAEAAAKSKARVRVPKKEYDRAWLAARPTYTKEWYAENRERLAEKRKREAVKLAKAAEAVSGKKACGICRSEERLHIEKDFVSGRTLGFLCASCKLGWGNFKRSRARLIAALAWAERCERGA